MKVIIVRLQPTRSNPVSMPNARPAYRRLSGSDSSPSPGHSMGIQSGGPLLIEAGIVMTHNSGQGQEFH